MSDKELVRFEKRGAIGIITVDNPPVNALSPGVPEGILAAVEKGNADPEIKAMILTGAGRSFIAGADIREFGKGRPRPARKTQDVLEDSEKPIVAAIHGFALGGGLEYALGCHYRVALKGTKVGLPEIALGLLPGGGGTQRLPRLVGPKIALDLITSGRHVPAEEAKQLGVLDEVFDSDLVGSAVKFAEGIADLLESADDPRVAVMCSESVWWRCHRRLVADVATLARDLPVHHLMHGGEVRLHEPSAGARVSDGVVVWDGPQDG